jgi:flagellar FliJ protein
MPKFNSLRIAIDLAASKRDQAFAALQRQRYSHDHAMGQMDQLQQYSNETEERWARSAQAGTSPELLHHHYQFMARLQQAVVLQKDALAGSLLKIKAAEETLLQEEIRMASLKVVLTKRQADQIKQMDRRDQKQMDEFAAMQTLRQMRQKLENHDVY